MNPEEQQEREEIHVLFFVGIGLSGVGVALVKISPATLVLTAIGLVLVVIGLIRTSRASSSGKD